MPGLVLGVVEAPIDETSLLVIVGAAALAGMLVMLASPKLVIPVVVVELILGIIVGPLGMLFFFAGYEINFERIRGRPMALAAIISTLVYPLVGLRLRR
jgi:Kef-type K+ transport system membrane component KefB